MRARVFYQDFGMNVRSIDKKDLVFVPESAILVRTFNINTSINTSIDFPIKKDEMCEHIWETMNSLNIPVGHPKRKLFEKIGHTSMSVGDYVLFDDKEVWIAAWEGWKIIPGE